MEELRDHLEDRAAAFRASGLGEEESMSEAIERFGKPNISLGMPTLLASKNRVTRVTKERSDR
jgi:hypothetical protein